MSIDYFFRWNGEICRKSTSGGRDVEEIYGWSKEIGQWGRLTGVEKERWGKIRGILVTNLNKK